MKVERIVNPEYSQNCYLVYDSNKKGLIIDPGSKADYIIKKIKEYEVDVKYIFLTHCHYDHIEGLEELRKELNAEVVSSFECNKNIQNPSVNLSSLFSFPIKAEASDIIVTDGDITEVGDMKVKTILTPGHTDGGTCYLIDDELFSGDTLFLNSVGRWDFPTGNEKVLKESIRKKLFTLDDDIIVHPGHGNDTKIYYEKRYNTFCKE